MGYIDSLEEVIASFNSKINRVYVIINGPESS